jgi:hypothetical protein
MSSWVRLFWSIRWDAVAWKPLNWSRIWITARRASSSSKTPACAGTGCQQATAGDSGQPQQRGNASIHEGLSVDQ